MANVTAPPTYAEVILVDEKAAAQGRPVKPRFNPIWLKWFVDLASFVSASGGGSGGAADHESLSNLLGGAANDHYHLTQAQHDYAVGHYTTSPSGITPGASPYAYHNTAAFTVDVIVQGGTVTKVEFSRDGSTYYDIGTLAGMFTLSPGDYLRTTYAVAPTMTRIPR